MCYLHRGFIRDIASPRGSFFCGITSLGRIRGGFRCATSTGSSFLRDLSHGHYGSYDKTTATKRRQTRDLSPPPDVKQRDNNVRRQRRRQRQEGGFDSRSEWRQRRRRGTWDQTSTTSWTRTMADLRERFGLAWLGLTISFLRCIANEAMGLIN